MPLPRVKFTHPESGEKVRGHLRSVGMNGAAILDDDGQTHRVPHGEYVREDPPRAALLDVAAKHLSRGPEDPLALAAACALLDEGGVRSPERLRWSDVRVDKDGSVLVVPDKVRVREPEALRKLLTSLLRNAGRGPLFVVEDRQVTPHEVAEYVRQFAPRPPKVLAKARPPGLPRMPGLPSVGRPHIPGASARPGYVLTIGPTGAKRWRKVTDASARQRGGVFALGAKHPLIIGATAASSSVPPEAFAELSSDAYKAIEYAHQHGHDAVVWMLTGPAPVAAPLVKASARAMHLPTLGAPERSWSEHGYRCSFRRQSGLGMLTIEHEDMPLPLHEIVSDLSKARSKASEFVGALQRGETPQGGVYAAVGA
jgi:hypothetical protein